MKRLWIMLVAMAFVVVGLTAGGAIAKTKAGGTFTDGPYSSTSPDSGTCGNNWAIDLATRTFVVTLPGNGDGTYNVVEKFKKGTFLTLAGDSPGACNGGPSNGNTVKEGVSGTFVGTFNMVVTGVFDSNGSCVREDIDGVMQCRTAGWVEGFFGPGATYDIPQFSFTYKARRQGLDFHQWTNADTGNTGDIGNSP
jgi:hypothetical protein